MPVKALLIASLVVAAFFCGSFTLATNAKSKTFHNGCNRGAGALANPKKCASSLDEDQYPDQRNPMKWAGATKPPSLSTNYFETNSSGHNTVCVRVAMVKEKNNVKKNNVFTCIGAKKIKKLGNIANPCAATKKALNEMTTTAVQAQNGIKSINLPVTLIHAVSTVTGTIKTSALAVKITPHPDNYYDLKKKKEAAGPTKKEKGAMEVKQSSGKRKSCVLTSVFQSWVGRFENLKHSPRTSPGKCHVVMFLHLSLSLFVLQK